MRHFTTLFRSACERVISGQSQKSSAGVDNQKATWVCPKKSKVRTECRSIIDSCAATKSLPQFPCPVSMSLSTFNRGGEHLSIPVEYSDKLGRSATKAPPPGSQNPTQHQGPRREWQVVAYLCFCCCTILMYAAFQIYISVSKCDCAWAECQLGEGIEGQDTQQWPLGRARRLRGAFFPSRPLG